MMHVHISLLPTMNNKRQRTRKRKREVQFLMKDQMSSLFKETEKYHRRRLKTTFRKYYWPVRGDDEWTIGISHDVIQQFKLHLSWEIGYNCFNMNRIQIGLLILKRYKTLGILMFLKQVIMNES